MDPFNDRHWAQHNLTAVTAIAKTIVQVAFTAANPLLVGAVFQVEVRAANERVMETLGRLLKATPRLRLESLQVQLLDDAGNPLTEQGSVASLQLDLDVHGQKSLQLIMHIDENLEHSEFAVEEVLLNRLSGEQKELVGSLGVLMRPEAG